jgi:hypothetical protein
MSSSQLKIINRLLLLAEKSTGGKNWQKHAAAICRGKKIVCESINNDRTKFGRNIYCCGHSEANCIMQYMNQNRAFQNKRNPRLVLAGLQGKVKS